jgi:hypothetical protein
MRTSLETRAVAASAAVALFLLSGPQAALAHGQMSFGAPALRPGFVHGHGWALGSRNASRQSSAFRGESGFRRNGRFRNGGWFYGPGSWYGPYGYADAGGGGGAGGLVIVVGAPALSVLPGAPAGAADPSPEGGCVIHKLKYDAAGNYVGERQTPGC